MNLPLLFILGGVAVVAMAAGSDSTSSAGTMDGASDPNAFTYKGFDVTISGSGHVWTWKARRETHETTPAGEKSIVTVFRGGASTREAAINAATQKVDAE